MGGCLNGKFIKLINFRAQYLNCSFNVNKANKLKRFLTSSLIYIIQNYCMKVVKNLTNVLCLILWLCCRLLYNYNLFKKLSQTYEVCIIKHIWCALDLLSSQALKCNIIKTILCVAYKWYKRRQLECIFILRFNANNSL